MSLVGLIAMAFLFDYTNGFHDSANSSATIVATRVLRPRYAVAWTAFFNFIAFLIVGTAVADTVGQIVTKKDFSVAVVFAALIGSITWNYLSWHLGLPTPSSHALVGGLVGGHAVRPRRDSHGGPAGRRPVSRRGVRAAARAARLGQALTTVPGPCLNDIPSMKTVCGTAAPPVVAHSRFLRTIFVEV